jgi:hypothetical protein
VPELASNANVRRRNTGRQVLNSAQGSGGWSVPRHFIDFRMFANEALDAERPILAHASGEDPSSLLRFYGMLLNRSFRAHPDRHQKSNKTLRYEQETSVMQLPLY